MKDYIIPIELDRSLDICQQIYINGPSHTVYNADYRGLTKTVNTGPAHTIYNTDYRGLTKTWILDLLIQSTIQTIEGLLKRWILYIASITTCGQIRQTRS
jgi:hypothetical protein